MTQQTIIIESHTTIKNNTIIVLILFILHASITSIHASNGSINVQEYIRRYEQEVIFPRFEAEDELLTWDNQHVFDVPTNQNMPNVQQDDNSSVASHQTTASDNSRLTEASQDNRKRTYRIYDEETKSKVVKALTSGVSIGQIKKTFKMREKTVYYLKKTRCNNDCQKQKTNNHTIYDEETKKMVLESTLSTSDASLLWNVPETTIRRWKRQNNKSQKN